MGSFSNSLKNVANNLLSSYGQSVTFTRYTTNEYDTATGAIDPVTSITFTGRMHPGPYRLDEIDGEMIQVNDISALVYSTTEPLINDSAVVDGVIYRVMNIEKIKAQGEAIVYRLQLRV